MKNKLTLAIIVLALFTGLHRTTAQGTAFTYQGRLNDGANPANGSYDLQFVLFNTNQFGFPAAPILTNENVSLNNGSFTTTLDFGAGIFTGINYWLDISVRTNGNGAFTDLGPRQPITPAPYAITAENLSGVVENNNIIQNGVSLGTISGGGGNIIQSGANDSTIGGGGNNSIGTNSFIATISGGANNSVGVNDDTSTISGGNQNIIQDGAGVSTIAGGVGNVIQTGSPRSTISGGSNNRILNNAEHSFIGGGDGNQIQAGSMYSTIGGGLNNVIQPNATYSAIFGGHGNTLYALYGFIGGGYFNTIQTNAGYSTIGGGAQNTIQTNTSFSTIGGGIQNVIQTNASYSTIGGGEGNTIQTNAQVSFIGGGDLNIIQANSGGSVIGGGVQNAIQTNAQDSTIGGGVFNNIQINAGQSTIGGGIENTIQPYATYSTIGGGRSNTIQTNGQQSVIGGGYQNTVQVNAQNDFIGGGYFNMIQANAYASTVGGGGLNTNGGSYSTIPGGYENTANGSYSFAAGQQAQALHQGAFVWADSQNAPFSSTANDQFLVRAQDGVGINMNNPGGASLYVQGNRTGGWGSSVGVFENTSTASGSSPALRVVVKGGNAPDGALNVSDNGTGPIAEFGNGIGFVASVENDGTIKSKGVVLTSDRNAKENFTSLDGKTVLAKVISLPVTEWNYKDDSAEKKHIGPVAQDFSAAFGLNGSDDKHISVVDEGGVALAAIQGLNQKLSEELKRRDAENAELKRQLGDLKQLVNSINHKLNGGDK